MNTIHWLAGPILFLDIDGVLNSLEFAKREQASGKLGGIIGIDPDAVKHLQRVVDETQCSIVLSSSWRIGAYVSDIRGQLIAAGMRHPCPLHDKTPVLEGKRVNGRYQNVLRGEEVKLWRDTAGHEGTYVCIDDGSDFLAGQPLVKTEWEIGMQSTHADLCIEILLGRR
jgi:Swiss Army Knife RNA repair-like protein